MLVFGSDLRSSITNSSLFSFTNGGIGSSSWDEGTSTFTITAISGPSTYVAAQCEAHRQDAVAVVADGVEPRFVGTMRVVRDGHTVRIFEDLLNSGKIDAMFREVGRFLVRIELQPNESNVCLVASDVNRLLSRLPECLNRR